MPVFTTKADLEQALGSASKKDGAIGLVPTMGALHNGHLTLVDKAIEENDAIVVSIFVNPTQFDDKSDLENYPRNLDADVRLLSGVSKDIVVFAPGKEEIYDGSATVKSFDFGGLDQVMEGRYRQGHFSGVATIVELLLTAVRPDRAYFGEKDFQQLQIIKKLVSQNGHPYQIRPCPIAREPNGLAMSSRNERLSAATRRQAGIVHEALMAAKMKFGTENAPQIAAWVADRFEKNALFDLEYFQIADAETLQPMTERRPTENIVRLLPFMPRESD